MIALENGKKSLQVSKNTLLVLEKHSEKTHKSNRAIWIMHRHFNAFAFHRTCTIDAKSYATHINCNLAVEIHSIHLGYSLSAFRSISNSCIGENEQFFPFVSHIFRFVCFHLCHPLVRALARSFSCLFFVILGRFFPLSFFMRLKLPFSIYF